MAESAEYLSAEVPVPYVCRKCHMPHHELVKRCPSCRGHWTILARPATQRQLDTVARVVSSTSAVEEDWPRISTGLGKQVDAVFGGGLAVGSVNLLWGAAGLGKTTLLLQLGRHVKTENVLLVQSEQPVRLVLSTMARLNAKREGFSVIATDDVDVAIREIERRPYGLVIIDSLQGLVDTSIDSFAGSIKQSKRIGKRLVRVAQARDVTMLITNHVITSGRQAGGTFNVHGVDATFELTGELRDPDGVRYLRTLKNRFGPPGVAQFRMGANGLEACEDEKAPKADQGKPTARG